MKNGQTAIKIQLLKKGVSMSHIAQLLGISRQAVSNTIAGKPSERVVKAIALAIGKAPEDVTRIIRGDK